MTDDTAPSIGFLWASAIEWHDMNAVKNLVGSVEDINRRDDYDWTMLMHAAGRGWDDAVRFLIEKDADIDAANGDGWTALMQAICEHRVETIGLLVECGADVDMRNEAGEAALDVAKRHDLEPVLTEAVSQREMKRAHEIASRKQQSLKALARKPAIVRGVRP